MAMFPLLRVQQRVDGWQMCIEPYIDDTAAHRDHDASARQEILRPPHIFPPHAHFHSSNDVHRSCPLRTVLGLPYEGVFTQCFNRSSIYSDPLYGSYTGADWIVFCVIVITSALLGRWSCSSCSSKYKDFATHTQPELLSRARQTPASDHSLFPHDKRLFEWDECVRMERYNPRREVVHGTG